MTMRMRFKSDLSQISQYDHPQGDLQQTNVNKYQPLIILDPFDHNARQPIMLPKHTLIGGS